MKKRVEKWVALCLSLALLCTLLLPVGAEEVPADTEAQPVQDVQDVQSPSPESEPQTTETPTTPYDTGFQDGYNSAYQKGYEQGYADIQTRSDLYNIQDTPLYEQNHATDNYQEGYQNGTIRGYSHGYTEGYDEGYLAKYPPVPFEEGYSAGYDAGYQKGSELGYADGYASYPDGETPSLSYSCDYPQSEDYQDKTYEEGYQVGENDGYEEAYYDSFWEGYYAAENDQKPPYEKGYQDGYDAGHTLGYEEGSADYPTYRPKDNTALYVSDDPTGSYENGYQNGSLDGYAKGYSLGSWSATLDNGGDDSQFYRQQRIVELGGVFGQPNVLVNGTCVAFPDAAPEFKDNRTMVPLRPVAEAIGATVEVSGDQIRIQRGGTLVQFTIGDPTASVTQDGKTEKITMDCASYTQENRTYVPLRFFAEGLHYDVFWDAGYQTAVLMQPQEEIAKLDGTLSIFNQLLQSQLTKAQAGNREITSTLTSALEVIDSIDGNRTFTNTGKFTVLTSGTTMSLEGTLDCSGSWALMQTWKNWYDAFPYFEVSISQETLATLEQPMQEIPISAKLDDAGNFYLQTPLISYMQQLFGAESDNPYTWYKIAQVDPALLSGKQSIGSLLYNAVTQSGGSAVDFYEILTTYGEALQWLVGDSSFTKSGDEYQWSFQLDRLAQTLGLNEEEMVYFKDSFPNIEATMSFTLDGDFTFASQWKEGQPGLGAMVNVEFEEALTAKGGAASLLLQIRNLFNATIELETTIRSTKESPHTSLPEGTVVHDLSTVF